MTNRQGLVESILVQERIDDAQIVPKHLAWLLYRDRSPFFAELADASAALGFLIGDLELFCARHALREGRLATHFLRDATSILRCGCWSVPLAIKAAAACRHCPPAAFRSLGQWLVALAKLSVVPLQSHYPER